MRFTRRIAVASVLFAGAALPAASARAATPDAAKAEEEVCEVPQVIVPRPANPADEPAWVSRRVRELQPNVLERKIDRIGWAKDIRAAEQLAREHNRPVFLFTLDGRMDTGRC